MLGHIYRTKTYFVETVRLTLFPFTLKDRTKILLESLTPLSKHTWAELQALFLKKKFFLTHKTISLKKQISTFTTKEGERFHQCWDIYIDAVSAYPHHGFEKLNLASFFYDGLNVGFLMSITCPGIAKKKKKKKNLKIPTLESTLEYQNRSLHGE